MNVLSPAAVLVDGNGNPISASPATALASGQSSVVVSGSDYGSTPKAQAQHVDALGQQYNVPTSTTGVAVPLGINTAGSSTGSFGQVALAWDATTSYWRPNLVDSTGASLSRSPIYPTFNWSPGALVSTTTTAGRSMISFYNATTTAQYQRWVSGYFNCAPQVNTTGGLAGIGSGTSYTAIYFEMHRFTTAHSGGTLVTSGAYDTADTVDANFTCRYGATISGETTPVLLQWDAAYDGARPIGGREDDTSKLMVIPPSSGLHVKCVSTLSTAVSFQIRVQTIQSAS